MALGEAVGRHGAVGVRCCYDGLIVELRRSHGWILKDTERW